MGSPLLQLKLSAPGSEEEKEAILELKQEPVSVRIFVSVDFDVENPTSELEFKMVSFCDRDIRSHKDRDEYFPLSIGLQSKLKAGTAFRLYYHRDWESQFEINDRSEDGLFIWEGKPSDLGNTYEDRKKSATSCINAYNRWANNANYYFTIEAEGEDMEEGGNELSDEDLAGCIKESLTTVLKSFNGREANVLIKDEYGVLSYSFGGKEIEECKRLAAN